MGPGPEAPGRGDRGDAERRGGGGRRWARAGVPRGLTFPEVPSPSTTIFSCRSWFSSSESDMVSREPGPPPASRLPPRGRGRKERRGPRGRGRERQAIVWTGPPPALVSQRPLAVSREKNSPGAILPASQPPARDPAPCALRGARAPTSAPTRADRRRPWIADPSADWHRGRRWRRAGEMLHCPSRSSCPEGKSKCITQTR